LNKTNDLLNEGECALPSYIAFRKERDSDKTTTDIIIGCVLGLIVCIVGGVVYKCCIKNKKTEEG
jgi:hypothetical protein